MGGIERRTTRARSLNAPSAPPAPFFLGLADAGLGVGISAIFVRETALSSASQAALVNNLSDGLAWGPFPIFFGVCVGRISVLAAVSAAVSAAVWGVGQFVTLSDRVGRKRLIAGGVLLRAAAIAMIAATFRLRALGTRRGAARRRHRHGAPDAAHRALRARGDRPRVRNPSARACRTSLIGHITTERSTDASCDLGLDELPENSA